MVMDLGVRHLWNITPGVSLMNNLDHRLCCKVNHQRYQWLEALFIWTLTTGLLTRSVIPSVHSIVWIIFIVCKFFSVFAWVYFVMTCVWPSSKWFSTQWWPSEHHNAWKFHIYRSVSDLKCILYLPLDRATYLRARNLTVTHSIVLWYVSLIIQTPHTLEYTKDKYNAKIRKWRVSVWWVAKWQMKQRPVAKNRFVLSFNRQERASKVKQFTGMNTGAEKQEHL
jgi:hypothetical protein